MDSTFTTNGGTSHSYALNRINYGTYNYYADVLILPIILN